MTKPKRGILQRLHDRDRQERDAGLVDHGTSGPAMAARPSRTLETIAAGVTLRQMEDTDLLALAVEANVVTRRQQDALSTLCRHWSGWRSGSRVTGGYGAVRGCPDLTPNQEASRRAYNALLSAAPADTRHALALIACGEWPTMTGAVGYLRRGADALADHLRLPA